MTEEVEKKIDEIHAALHLQHLQWLRPKHMPAILGVGATRARQIYTSAGFPPMQDLDGMRGWPAEVIRQYLKERPVWRRRENAGSRVIGLK